MRPSIFMAALGVALGTLVALAEPQNMLPALDRALRRFSDASNSFILRTLTTVRPESQSIDPKAAANLDEDLDWRIAAQSKTEKGWRDFLAAHPSGNHAPLAQAALAALEPMPMPKPVPKPQPPPVPPPPPAAAPAHALSPVVEVANTAPKAPNVFALLERLPPQETKVETIVKWREARPRYVKVYARLRHYSRPRQPPPFFLSWFGPRAPYPGR